MELFAAKNDYTITKFLVYFCASSLACEYVDAHVLSVWIVHVIRAIWYGSGAFTFSSKA